MAVLVTGMHEFSPKLMWNRNRERSLLCILPSTLLHRKSKEELIKEEIPQWRRQIKKCYALIRNADSLIQLKAELRSTRSRKPK
jgi:hypothetical protein